MLAPIFNPITHMVALPFPLLLIFPGIAIDLLLRGERGMQGGLRLARLAFGLGGVFLAVFFVAQWYFSAFLLSPRAQNWFFMSDRVWSYSFRGGEWQTTFWRADPAESRSDAVTLLAMGVTWLIASASSGVGLFFGRWMRKVRR
jgi:hypothetical protein